MLVWIIVLPSMTSNVADEQVGAIQVSTWKLHEQLLPSLSGKPNFMQPQFILYRKIVTLKDESFKAAVVKLLPVLARLYRDEREWRDGSYCYEVAHGMPMVPLITKMIFPLTVTKLIERFHDDKMDYPSNNIRIMEHTKAGHIEVIQYHQVYLEGNNNILVPTGVYAMITTNQLCTH